MTVFQSIKGYYKNVTDSDFKPIDAVTLLDRLKYFQQSKWIRSHTIKDGKEPCATLRKLVDYY